MLMEEFFQQIINLFGELFVLPYLRQAELRVLVVISEFKFKITLVLLIKNTFKHHFAKLAEGVVVVEV
jgi:hypothetical protein